MAEATEGSDQTMIAEEGAGIYFTGDAGSLMAEGER
jgi:hypothetical protein